MSASFFQYIQLARHSDGSIAWTSSESLPGVAFWTVSALFVLRFVLRAFSSKGVRIAGSTFLITGASSGIGESLAREIVAMGGTVALVARNIQALNKLKDELNRVRPNAAFAYQADCSKEEDVDRFSAQVKRELDIPNVIVNCAGAGRWRYLFEMDGEEIKSCMDAPYFSAALVSKAFLPGFIERRAGSIVNVQSPAGWAPWGGATAYACTRYALRGLTFALRADLFGTGVNVQEVILAETTSNYFKVNGDSHERLPKIAVIIGTLTPQQAAQSVVQSIQSGAFISAYPWRLSALLHLYNYIPAIIDRAVWYTGWTVEKSKEKGLASVSATQHRKKE